MLNQFLKRPLDHASRNTRDEIQTAFAAELHIGVNSRPFAVSFSHKEISCPVHVLRSLEKFDALW